MNRPTTKLDSIETITNWFEGNETSRKQTLIKDLKANGYLEHNLDLNGLKDIKITFALTEELERCLENKATLNIIKILMDLGLKRI